MQKNLEVGKIYPSVKNMCEILEMIYKDSTDSRKANLKEIETMYLLEKLGRKYKVIEEYETIKEKVDNRKNNGGHVTTTKYETLLDQLFLDWLLEENIRGNATTTKNNLFVENDEIINIPLLQKDYKEMLNIGYEKFAKKEGMSKGLVLTYMQKINKVVETSLLTVLNRLQKQNIINWQKNIMVRSYSELDPEIADKEMEDEIKVAEKETYEKLGITPFERVNPKINKKFMTTVCSNFPDLSSYWRIYNIDILNEEVVENSLLDDQKRIEITNELIIRYVDSVNEAVKNKTNNVDDGKEENILGKKKIKKTYKPYTSEKNIGDLNALNKMIWKLPDGYKTFDEEIYELFGEDDWTKESEEDPD